MDLWALENSFIICCLQKVEYIVSFWSFQPEGHTPDYNILQNIKCNSSAVYIPNHMYPMLKFALEMAHLMWFS